MWLAAVCAAALTFALRESAAAGPARDVLRRSDTVEDALRCAFCTGFWLGIASAGLLEQPARALLCAQLGAGAGLLLGVLLVEIGTLREAWGWLTAGLALAPAPGLLIWSFWGCGSYARTADAVRDAAVSGLLGAAASYLFDAAGLALERLGGHGGGDA